MTIGIDDGKFILFDKWPGVPVQVAVPADLTTVYDTSADIPCPLGTKIAVYQATNHGYATFIMLQYEKGTATAATVKSLCGLDTTEAITAGAQYIVTNDGGEAFDVCGLAAVALNTVADGNCAFFWCGGVCPVDSVSGLDGVHKSDGSITAGNRLYMVDSASICKLALLAENVVSEAVGVAFVADTTS
jgi:hypothetical protein